jgi:uncharacterized protein YhaN
MGRSLVEATAEGRRIEEDGKNVEQRRQGWNEAWQRATSWLTLPPEASCSEVTLVLDQLQLVGDGLERAQNLEKDIGDRKKAIAKYEAEVFSLAQELTLEVGGRSAEDLMSTIAQALQQAQKGKERRASLEEQLRELSVEQAELEKIMVTMKGRLRELMRQANVESLEDLARAENQAHRQRELICQKNELILQLQEAGDGFSLEELKKQASHYAMDALPSLIEDEALNVKELGAKLEQLQEQRSLYYAREKELDSSALATEAQEQAMQVLTQLRDDVERYLRARTAAYILETEIERFRRENQPPLLSRASGLFSRLTLGFFKGLHDDQDTRGNPIILGIRPDDRQVPVEGMSDGTCDQLYLALRLAALERHLQQGEPMPFVVDDILLLTISGWWNWPKRSAPRRAFLFIRCPKFPAQRSLFCATTERKYAAMARRWRK